MSPRFVYLVGYAVDYYDSGAPTLMSAEVETNHLITSLSEAYSICKPKLPTESQFVTGITILSCSQLRVEYPEDD